MMPFPRSVRFAGLALLSILASAAIAAPKGTTKAVPSALPRYGVAVYSDLCFERRSGEIGGQRIVLHRFAEVDTVIYEFTAGGLSWPLVAREVNLDTGTGAFNFTVLIGDDEQRTIAGTFSKDGSSLTLDGGYCADASIPMVLPKVTEFGASLKACKACPQAKPAPSSAPAPLDTAPAADMPLLQSE